MNNAETLKEYKELLDNNIITQEEFDKKKHEVLLADYPDFSGKDAAKSTRIKVPKIQISKIVIKRIVIALCAIVVLAAGGFGIKAIVEHNQQAARITALEEEIKPIMNEYGLYRYAVKYAYHSYEVYAEGFESLTYGQALECLKKLDRVSIDDPYGDGKIDFGVMTNVHPGLDVDYTYWRVSSSIAKLNEMVGGNYKTPGIYCDKFGSECIFAYEN